MGWRAWSRATCPSPPGSQLLRRDGGRRRAGVPGGQRRGRGADGAGAAWRQRAENESWASTCGIMDQFVSRLGHPGHALFLDCRSLEFDLIPIPGDEYRLRRGELPPEPRAGGLRLQRAPGAVRGRGRASCERACPTSEPCATSPRRSPAASGSRLDPVVYRRARHVVTENERVLLAVEALRASDLADASAG